MAKKSGSEKHKKKCPFVLVLKIFTVAAALYGICEAVKACQEKGRGLCRKCSCKSGSHPVEEEEAFTE